LILEVPEAMVMMLEAITPVATELNNALDYVTLALPAGKV